MMPSNRLCFAASASRRLCSNAAGIDRGSGEDGAETESESSPARVRTSAASGEAGTSSRGEGGFDRLLTFSSGLPLPDPLASPLARARSSPSSFPRVALGCASLVGLCPAEGPGPESRGPGGRFSASRSGVSSRTSHPEPGVPSGAPSRHRDHRRSRPPRTSRRCAPSTAREFDPGPPMSNPACETSRQIGGYRGGTFGQRKFEVEDAFSFRAGAPRRTSPPLRVLVD